MKRSEFQIGKRFHCGGKGWLCTDVGTRTILAIEIVDPDPDDWMHGPPYAVAEVVFDENDMPGCTRSKPRHAEAPRPARSIQR
jgi:hypothetical protein